MAEPATSKELILCRMNSETRYTHFTRWEEFEKAKATADCGLAKYNYDNKGERGEVLTHLASCDLQSHQMK